MNKFTNEFWLQVRKDFDTGLTQAELRKKYAISKGALGNKIKRDNWNLQTVEELQNKIIIKVKKENLIKKKEPKIKPEKIEKPKPTKVIKEKEIPIIEEQKETHIEPICEPIEKPIQITVEDTKQESIYDKHLSTVKTLLIANVEHSKIARIIGISEKVFNYLFYVEIENALFIADAEVLNSIYIAATDPIKPNPQCQKLWIELQAKRKEQKDKEVVEVNPFSFEFQAPKSK
jgi:hypothetical protein